MFGGPFHFSWFLRPSFDEKLAASPMTEILMTTGMTNNKLKKHIHQNYDDVFSFCLGTPLKSKAVE